jgi:hypothetical protein
MGYQKALEAAVAYSQTLSQWALLILGGSAAVILRDSHVRPDNRLVSYCYFLFIPGWICEALTMFYGSRAQGAYIGFLASPRPDPIHFLVMTNTFANRQVCLFRLGLVFFGAWLVAYLVWWVVREKESPSGV